MTDSAVRPVTGATMRRARYHEYGGPDVIRLDTVPVPMPQPDEVLIRMISVNGGELAARSGRARAILTSGIGFPKGLGMDVVGTVEEVGENVSQWRRGSVVWGVSTKLGGAADCVTMKGDRIALAPSSIDPVQAAALPCVGTTALAAVDRVLIRGGSGGVGSLAIQLAHHHGAHVTTLASGRTLEALLALGADKALDHRSTVPSSLGKFDVVVDTDLEAYRRLLEPNGRMGTITVDFDHLMKSVGVLLVSAFRRPRIRFVAGVPDTGQLTKLATLVDQGIIRPVIDSSYRLTDIRAAHNRAEQPGILGKVVISMK